MLKIIRFVILLLLLSILFTIKIEASEYPLQTKYPQTMIYKGEIDKRIIALTFDDGPDERFTPPILDILKKHDVKATFFLLGSRLEKYVDVAKRIQNEGHVIGSHTYWHPDLTKENINRLIWEIDEMEKLMIEKLDINPKLFRAPYGALNESHVEKLAELGYRGVGWSVDSEDWKSISKEKVKQNVLNQMHPGAIVLMHSAGHWTQDLTGTVEALDELIVFLKRKEYEFVTVPEMWETVYK